MSAIDSSSEDDMDTNYKKGKRNLSPNVSPTKIEKKTKVISEKSKRTSTVDETDKTSKPKNNAENNKKYFFNIKIGDSWSSTMEAILALSKDSPDMDVKTQMNRNGGYMLVTTNVVTKNRLIKIKKIKNKEITFELLPEIKPVYRYVISGVPFTVPEEHFVDIYGITNAQRIYHGSGDNKIKTRAILLVASNELPDKIRVGFGPYLPVQRYIPQPPLCFHCYRWNHVNTQCKFSQRCYKCGKSHTTETCKAANPITHCLNCNGSHSTAYKGCPARLEIVEKTKERLGVPTKINKPPTANAISTTSSNHWQSQSNTMHTSKEIILTEKDFPLPPPSPQPTVNMVPVKAVEAVKVVKQTDVKQLDKHQDLLEQILRELASMSKLMLNMMRILTRNDQSDLDETKTLESSSEDSDGTIVEESDGSEIEKTQCENKKTAQTSTAMKSPQKSGGKNQKGKQPPKNKNNNNKNST